ncbi:MAG TPA: SAM-dependent methyltransferase [bacterium]|nr:SAM-dependent methyltransferase [bacterium]
MKTKRSPLKPIGLALQGRILVDPKWAKGLTGLEGFSHILALFWMDRAHKPDLLIKPKSRLKFPSIGFLATRTAHRPNPLGLTVLKLVKHQGNVLFVEGLDVWDGTPVLDLKPYTKRDSVKGFKIPHWVRKLDKLETDPLRRYGS